MPDEHVHPVSYEAKLIGDHATSWPHGDGSRLIQGSNLAIVPAYIPLSWLAARVTYYRDVALIEYGYQVFRSHYKPNDAVARQKAKDDVLNAMVAHLRQCGVNVDQTK